MVPALVQNVWGEPRNRKAVCGAVASAFCFGGGEQIPACVPLLSQAGGMQAHGSAVAPGASLVGVLALGGGLGGLVCTCISGWDSSVPGEPVIILLQVLHQGCKGAYLSTV